ncbi:MAG TPA: methyltransferase domain-containing protein [Burkholderiales bacterium]|nr:methyltransferase domain-containing protein [Burkholderiales bacterium]HSC93886.1 methyltransferase domain-containing protein [Burkholderiales bacterium]HSF22507.1 methyltransferase domain-containing protein [Burkholderiales bacterium]
MSGAVAPEQGFYGRHVLPHLVHLACSLKPIRRQREKVVPMARGRVLEIGVGSGLNLAYYDPGKVSRLFGLDPSAEMIAKAKRAARSSSLEIEFLNAQAESIPLESKSVDTVLVTYSLCTIPQTEPALKEMRRVLRSGGRLVFCEHGLAPDPNVRKWQDRITPFWRRFAGGCHLNRDIPALIEQGGFRIEDMESMYLPGWRPATFNYWGTAERQ